MKTSKTPATLIVGMLALAAAVAAHADAPTRLLSQEMGHVAPDQSFSVDLDYQFTSTGLDGGLRIGAFGGEVLIDSKSLTDFDGSTLAFTNIGYKANVAKNFAAYGLISYINVDNGTTSNSFTDFGIGVAYTIDVGSGLSFNVNPELLTDDTGIRGKDTTFFLRGGVKYDLPVKTKVSLIGEVALEDNDVLDTAVNLGARWEPRKGVTIDFIIYNDMGDNGSTKGGPGAIRANIAL